MNVIEFDGDAIIYSWIWIFAFFFIWRANRPIKFEKVQVSSLFFFCLMQVILEEGKSKLEPRIYEATPTSKYICFN